MRASISLLAFVALLPSCGSRDESGSNGSKKPAAAAAPSAKGVAAPGSGDRSGTSMANAMALEKGKPLDLVVPCKGKLWVGPFTFPGSPSKIEVGADLKAGGADQLCAGGWWVDGQDTFVEHARIGCVEPALPRKVTFPVEYSPANGGSSANPVYMKLGYDEDMPAGCQPLKVKLSLP